MWKQGGTRKNAVAHPSARYLEDFEGAPTGWQFWNFQLAYKRLKCGHGDRGELKEA